MEVWAVMANYNGGTIGKTNEPIATTSGSYTLREQSLYKRDSNWPGSHVTSGLLLRVDASDSLSYSGSGTTWSDISGNGRDLTLVNGTSFNSNGYFDFDGTNDYVTRSNSGLGTGNPAHTLEIWANFDNINVGRWWLAVLGQYSTGSLHWIGNSTTNTQFGEYGGGAGTQNTPTLSGNGVWQHIVGTFDGTTSQVYVNGVTSGSSAAPTFNMTNSNIYIGLRANSIERFYNGQISVISLYDRGLTAAEVAKNYDAIRARYGL